MDWKDNPQSRYRYVPTADRGYKEKVSVGKEAIMTGCRYQENMVLLITENAVVGMELARLHLELISKIL